jgi:RNA polymerase sigma-70 factor, ECF subfamily
MASPTGVRCFPFGFAALAPSTERGRRVADPLTMAAEVVSQEYWLSSFYAGDRAAVERCYREHQRAVADAVGRLLPPADAETVTHEVFYSLLSDARLRENFQGGHFATWIVRVARNRALDYLRRRKRERPEILEDLPYADERFSAERVEEEIEAKRLVERFRRECLPPKWAAVFEARFVRQLSQRQAASELGMRRTTLLYQEHRIRAILEKFLVHADDV